MTVVVVPSAACVNVCKKKSFAGDFFLPSTTKFCYRLLAPVKEKFSVDWTFLVLWLGKN